MKYIKKFRLTESFLDDTEDIVLDWLYKLVKEAVAIWLVHDEYPGISIYTAEDSVILESSDQFNIMYYLYDNVSLDLNINGKIVRYSPTIKCKIEFKPVYTREFDREDLGFLYNTVGVDMLEFVDTIRIHTVVVLGAHELPGWNIEAEVTKKVYLPNLYHTRASRDSDTIPQLFSGQIAAEFMDISFHFGDEREISRSVEEWLGTHNS